MFLNIHLLSNCWEYKLIIIYRLISITMKCRKAGQKLNVLARASRISDSDTKMLLFNLFIISQFNFCPIVAIIVAGEICLKIDECNIEP